MNDHLRDRLKGKFVVLDGPDGCGKTTQLDLLANALQGAGFGVVRTKDPGGTEIGDRIRDLLLGHHLHRMDVRCETLLFMASRAQLVAEVIAPALKIGRCVLCDRFISSTCAYQGAGGHDVRHILKLAGMAVGDIWPDLTCVLDLPADVGLQRVQRRPCGNSGNAADNVDAMESRPLEFHRRVREVFRKLPEFYPKPVVVVDAIGSVQEVHVRVIEALGHADF